MNKTSMQSKKQFVPNAFKFLVAVGSVAGTLGIWNLLANKDLQQVNSQNDTGDQSVSNILQTPLPTIVPLVSIIVPTSNISTSEGTVNQPAANLPLREITQPPASTNVNPPANSNPVIISAPETNPSNSNPVIIPAPVTTTRTSKP